jgi:hypothetical protein
MTLLFEFAWMGDYTEALQELAELAQPENWEYRYTTSEYQRPILNSYLTYTYLRLGDQGKIQVMESPERACFNTGLVTANQEAICALFEPNPVPDRQPWKLVGFYKESDRNLLPFNPLPPIASYYEDPCELLYDTRLKMRVDYDHILEHNRERFPEPYRSMNAYQLRIYLQAVVEQAVIRVRRSYKTAIPQFYQGRIQLLLPLCLDTPARGDLALVVERYKDVYRANTCLTLDMAYNNARLIARPDDEWLQP